MSYTINSFLGKYRFLSNFFRVDILYDGLVYTSAEHAYQAAKSIDSKYRKTIQRAWLPSYAKKLGRRVELRRGWDEDKLDIMYDILIIKFQDKKLKELLIGTGDTELVEGNNWHDNFWGDCQCLRCRSIVGENNLGKLLMKVRDELHEQ